MSFSSGVDTKNDPKQLALGKLVTLTNGQFQVGKKISKRPGFSVYTQNIQGGGAISAAIGVATYQNELNLLDGSNLYSYSSGLNAHVSRGTYLPVSLSVYPVVRNTHRQTNADSAYHAATGLQMFVYSDTFTDSGGTHTYVNYTIVDTQTGAQVVKDQQLTTTATAAKVLSLGSYFVALYYDGTSVCMKSIVAAAPQTLSSQSIIASPGSSSFWDATVSGSNIYVGYWVSGTNTAGFQTISSSLVVSSPFVSNEPAEHIDRALSIKCDGTNLWCAYGAVANVRLFAINQATLSSTTLARKTVEALSFGQGSINLGISVTATTATILYEVMAYSVGAVYNASLIRSNTVTLSGTVGTASTVIRQMGMASKPFVVNGTIYLLAAYAGNTLAVVDGTFTTATIEPSYFLINLSGQIIAKVAQGNGGGYCASTLLPEALSISGSYSLPYLIKDDLSAVSGAVFYQTGVQSASFGFAVTQAPAKVEAGSNLHLSGGQTWMYDGAGVVEHGFHVFPENVTPATPTSSGGAIGSTVGRLSYVAVYEWSDNQGQIHRSAPSIPVSATTPASGVTAYVFYGAATKGLNYIINVATTAGGPTWPSNLMVGQTITDVTAGSTFGAGTYITKMDSANQKIWVSQAATANSATNDNFTTSDVTSITVTVPTLTATNKSGVGIALYRTAINGTIYYRVSSLTSPTLNDKTADSVQFTDTLSDNILTGNEQLYTNSGEVENIAAPAFTVICPYKNRLVGIPAENPYSYWFSKDIIPGVPVEFSDLFIQNVGALGGPLTAAAQLDDKLVLFKRSRVLISAGDGPTPSGLNNDFLDPQLVSADTGCSNPKSVVITPVGVMYQSPKGIYLLDRSLTNHYIGADVEAFNAYTVTSAVLAEAVNQVCFTLNTGTILVYDYYASQWSTYTTAQAGVDSTVYNHSYAFVTALGVTNYQSTSFSDNGSVVPLTLKTGWINLGGIQNLVRVRELMLVGEYKSPHTLTINIYTDYSSVLSQTAVIPVLSDPGLYQFKVAMKVQKIEAMQIEIIESQSGSGAEGFNISAVSFRAGIKAGLKNLKSAQAY